ncbi:MAG: hypothetical protein ACRBB6_16780 [Neptuniibacter sp.]
MLDLMICKCPHCHKSGIGLLDKLLASASYPAKCRACDRKSITSSTVIYGILGLSAAFLAVVPNSLSGQYYDIAAVMAFIGVVVLKVLGPLSKYDL